MKIYRFALLLCGLVLISACTLQHPPAYQLPDASKLVAGKTILVRPGDNLYTIAQQHKVRLNEIIVVNAMQPPYRVNAGETIYLPEKVSGKTKYYAPPLRSASTRTVEKKPLRKVYKAARSTSNLNTSRLAKAPNAHTAVVKRQVTKKKIVKKTVAKTKKTAKKPIKILPRKKKKQAAEKKRVTQLGVPPFIWPVRGTIISAFGPKGKGRDNDGVNIAAPRNAPVKAADGGTVVYADNKMKGFGNLVLIRHKGGWVTAYAHLGRILAKRDKQISKGDVIGTIGTSGGVASPQLHFETRRDGKPTDPELVVR